MHKQSWKISIPVEAVAVAKAATDFAAAAAVVPAVVAAVDVVGLLLDRAAV